MMYQSETASRSRSCRLSHSFGEPASLRSSSKSRRIKELEDELQSLRKTTKVALEQSWNETEALQKNSAEKDETINMLRHDLAESKSSEEQWKRKFEEVNRRILAQSCVESCTASSMLVEQKVKHYSELLQVAPNDECDRWVEETRSVSAPQGDVSNRSLFCTIRKSITLLRSSRCGELDVAGNDSSCGEINELSAGSCDLIEPSLRPRHLPPPPGRLPPRPKRKPFKRHCSAPIEEKTMTEEEEKGRGTAAPANIKSSSSSSWHARTFTEISAIEKLQDECEVAPIPTLRRASAMLDVMRGKRDTQPSSLPSNHNDKSPTACSPTAKNSSSSSWAQRGRSFSEVLCLDDECSSLGG